MKLALIGDGEEGYVSIGGTEKEHRDIFARLRRGETIHFTMCFHERPNGCPAIDIQIYISMNKAEEEARSAVTS